MPRRRSGAPVGLSFIQPRTVDDLVRRRAMVKIWADATCGMFGRSPDYMNVMTAGLRLGQRCVRPSRQTLRRQHARLLRICPRERHLHDAHAGQPAGRSLAPGGAPGKGPGGADRAGRPMPASSSTARAWWPRCARSRNDIMVMPSTFVTNNKEGEPYAFGFCIPVATAGTALHLPPPGDASARRRRRWTFPCRRGWTRPTRWWCSTTCWCRGSACSSTATRSCATRCTTAPASIRM